MAMTRKDFQIVADEFGYDLKRNGFRLMSEPRMVHNTVIPVAPSDDESTDPQWDVAKGFTISLNSIMAAFQSINPNFSRDRFLTAIQTAATKGA